MRASTPARKTAEIDHTMELPSTLSPTRPGLASARSQTPRYRAHRNIETRDKPGTSTVVKSLTAGLSLPFSPRPHSQSTMQSRLPAFPSLSPQGQAKGPALLPVQSIQPLQAEGSLSRDNSRGSTSVSPRESLSPRRVETLMEGDITLQDKLPVVYDNICVQPWKEKAEEGAFRQHIFRRNAAFARTLLPETPNSPSSSTRQAHHRDTAASHAHGSPQIQHMEREMLKHRREIETLVRTALQEQMREVELNQKLKDTLCYGCWVNLCLIITDEADKYQVESQKMCELRKLLDKFEARSEQLRSRTAFEAAAEQISHLQKQLGIHVQKYAELQAHAELQKQQLLDVKDELNRERQRMLAESERAFCQIQDLETRLQEALQKNVPEQNAISGDMSEDQVLEGIFRQLDTENTGTLSIEELKESLLSMVPHQVDPADYGALVQVISTLDAENSGVLRLNQLREVMSNPTVSHVLRSWTPTSALHHEVKDEEDQDAKKPQPSAPVTVKPPTTSTVQGHESEIQRLRAQLNANEKKFLREKGEWERQKKVLETKWQNPKEAKTSTRTGLQNPALRVLMTRGMSPGKGKFEEKVVEDIINMPTAASQNASVGNKGINRLKKTASMLQGGKAFVLSSKGSVTAQQARGVGVDDNAVDDPCDSEDERDALLDMETGQYDTSDIVRRRNQKYFDLGAVLASLGSSFHFNSYLDRYYGRRPEVMLKMMEKEFENYLPARITASKYGGIETTLQIEWDFVMNPSNEERLCLACEQFGWRLCWPNSTKRCSFSGVPFPQRTPMPLERFLEHSLAKLANLNKAEIAGIRLFTGFAYSAINKALRSLISEKPIAQVEQKEAMSRTNSFCSGLDARNDQTILQRNNSDPSLNSKNDQVLPRSSSIERSSSIVSTSSFQSKIELSVAAISFSDHQIIQQHAFTATASAINSGLKKLSAVSNILRDKGGCSRLYRGLSNLSFDSKLLQNHECHEQEAVDLMVLQRFIHSLDKSILREALEDTPGLLCAAGEDGEFTKDQVDRVRRQLEELLQHAVDDFSACPILNTSNDMASVVRGLREIMDEQQVHAMIRHGLKRLKEETLTEDELLAVRNYLAGKKSRTFIELAFTSATPDLHVALQYSSNEKFATILEIEIGDMDRAASLAWISQFPDEDEHTILAVSSFEVLRLRRELKRYLLEQADFLKEERRLEKRISDLQHMIELFPDILVTNLVQEGDLNSKTGTSKSVEVPEATDVLTMMRTQLSEDQSILDDLRDDWRETKTSFKLEAGRPRFHDYVNVITVRLNVNTKAATSEQLLEDRKRLLIEFGNKLILEAENDRYCGQKIISKLAEKMGEYSRIASSWFDQVINLHRALNDLLEEWEIVVKRSKMESCKVLKGFSEIRDLDDINHTDLFAEAAKMMKLCEASNPKDMKEFWPYVLQSFATAATIVQRDGGADAVIDTILGIHDSALYDNVANELLIQVLTHVLDTALAEEAVLEVMFSDMKWQHLQRILPGRSRREANEEDIEHIVLYMDVHYKKASSTLLQGFRLLNNMINGHVERDDRRALADVRTRLARCGAIQVVVRAFSAVQEDMKGLEKPPPRHPLPVVQQGCRLLESMTSTHDVHEENVKLCQTENLTKSMLKVLDNHRGDEIIIESLLHLFIHFDFASLENTSRSTEFNLVKLFKELSQSVKVGKQEHQTISKQVRTLVERQKT